MYSILPKNVFVQKFRFFFSREDKLSIPQFLILKKKLTLIDVFNLNKYFKQKQSCKSCVLSWTNKISLIELQVSFKRAIPTIWGI